MRIGIRTILAQDVSCWDFALSHLRSLLPLDSQLSKFQCGALKVHKQFLESDHWQLESGTLVDVKGHVVGNREPVVASIQVGLVRRAARQCLLHS